MATDQKEQTMKHHNVSKLLINGFIREIEDTLNNQIIPISINTVCWEYYYVAKLLFCINISYTPDKLFIADIHSNNENKALCINDIDENIGSLFLSGCCITNEFTSFPASISTQINPYTTCVLFKCGGWVNGTSHGLIVDTNTFSVIDMNLPKIPEDWTYGNSVGFSSQSQLLISVGDEHRVHGLKFDKTDQESLEWEKLKPMIHERYNPTAVMIDSCNKLMVAGGKESEKTLNSAEIYDIETNEWNEIASFEIARRAAGMHYNQYIDEVYLGGGIDDKEDGHSVECYDFHKNKWNLKRIPRTQFAHKLHPIMWIENNNLLYIASICGKHQRKSSNSCEYIDLRVGNKWNTVISDSLLKNVFGINNDPCTEAFCLLCN